RTRRPAPHIATLTVHRCFTPDARPRARLRLAFTDRPNRVRRTPFLRGGAGAAPREMVPRRPRGGRDTQAEAQTPPHRRRPRPAPAGPGHPTGPGPTLAANPRRL